jgi:uncharacterized protein with HEPN domain
MSPDRAYLVDVIDAANAALEYVRGMTIEEFRADRKTQHAVIRCLELIGEAAKNLTPEVKAAIPAIEWRQMGNMRNLMIHRYWEIDLVIVWDTVHNDLPPLISAIEAYQQP